jgi:hypothetical protein
MDYQEHEDFLGSAVMFSAYGLHLLHQARPSVDDAVFEVLMREAGSKGMTYVESLQYVIERRQAVN